MKFWKCLDYLYPPRCPVCGEISSDGICPVCTKKLFFVKEHYCMKCGKPLEAAEAEYCRDCSRRQHAFVRGRALLSYRGPVKLSLYRMKYGNRREYARVYGQTMAHRLGPWICQCGIGLIIPVPLHPSRKRKRGYNQAEWLAKGISDVLHIPVDTHTLYRVRRTKPQKKLNDIERKQNLQGAFSVKCPLPPHACPLLADDIYTTGSTVDEAARCLQAAGECKVYVAAVAIGG